MEEAIDRVDGGAGRALTRAAIAAVAAGAGQSTQQRSLAARLEAGGGDTSPAAVLADCAGGDRLWSDDGVGVAALADRLAGAGAVCLVAGGSGYPPMLAPLWPELGAPAWLFARPGDHGLPAPPAVAIVGTRRATVDGRRTAARLAELAADAGVTVVSGMARGIDQAAHRAALAKGGATVGVLGAGFGVDYPKGSVELREAVRASGGLLAEVPPGAPPRGHHFLERNRLISGLAAATVVVEGRERSGAMHTARMAASQGRCVYAVPGSLNAPTAAGPLSLVADGATLVTSYDDIGAVMAGLAAGGGADRSAPVPAPVETRQGTWRTFVGASSPYPGAKPPAASGTQRGRSAPSSDGSHPTAVGSPLAATESPAQSSGAEFVEESAPGDDAQAHGSADATLSQAARSVAAVLGARPATIDELCGASELGAHEVMRAVSELVLARRACMEADGVVAAGGP